MCEHFIFLSDAERYPKCSITESIYIISATQNNFFLNLTKEHQMSINIHDEFNHSTRRKYYSHILHKWDVTLSIHNTTE